MFKFLLKQEREPDWTRIPTLLLELYWLPPISHWRYNRRGTELIAPTIWEINSRNPWRTLQRVLECYFSGTGSTTTQEIAEVRYWFIIHGQHTLGYPYHWSPHWLWHWSHCVRNATIDTEADPFIIATDIESLRTSQALIFVLSLTSPIKLRWGIHIDTSITTYTSPFTATPINHQDHQHWTCNIIAAIYMPVIHIYFNYWE